MPGIMQASQASIGIGSWCLCSIGMMVFNKLAIQNLQLECTLVMLQMAFTCLFLGIFTFRSMHIGSFGDVLRWAIVVPFFSGMLLTSILALKNAPMSLVVVFRGLSPIFGLMIERFYPDPLQVNADMMFSLLLMITGGIFYASQLESSAMTGIGWVLLNNFFAVGDRLLQRLMLAKDQCPVDMSKTAITFISNLLGLLPILVAMIMTQEFREAPAALKQLDSMGIVWVSASCFVGVGISYTGVWCQSLISATSFMVLINANKFVIIFIEAFIMKSKSINHIQILGACMTITAGLLYSYGRDRMEKLSKLDEEEAAEEEKVPILDSAKKV
eukprot:TRINITY_DN1575_c1_g2_i6.p1 TRINITY_DN1575_c1_g2~~TRINITY_DN1575_c1_g2_i6.p1  ORF type:complete len:329 (+),score=65.13 TRINITY_DN1575_c1_g2_i6:74-1060(+)